MGIQNNILQSDTSVIKSVYYLYSNIGICQPIETLKAEHMHLNQLH